jgi:hypothetical protein
MVKTGSFANVKLKNIWLQVLSLSYGTKNDNKLKKKKKEKRMTQNTSRTTDRW